MESDESRLSEAEESQDEGEASEEEQQEEEDDVEILENYRFAVRHQFAFPIELKGRFIGRRDELYIRVLGLPPGKEFYPIYKSRVQPFNQENYDNFRRKADEARNRPAITINRVCIWAMDELNNEDIEPTDRQKPLNQIIYDLPVVDYPTRRRRYEAVDCFVAPGS